MSPELLSLYVCISQFRTLSIPSGAGLYESITMDATVTTRIDYMDDRLVQDAAYRRDLTSRICKVGGVWVAARVGSGAAMGTAVSTCKGTRARAGFS